MLLQQQMDTDETQRMVWMDGHLVYFILLLIF